MRDGSWRIAVCPTSSPGVADTDDEVDGGGERISGQGALDAAVNAAAAAAYMLTRSPAW